MAINFFDSLKDAFGNLNPDEIRLQMERPLKVGLFAQSESAFSRMEAFLASSVLIREPIAQSTQLVVRAANPPSLQVPGYDIEIYSDELQPKKGAFTFDPNQPERLVSDIIKEHPGFAVTLARRIPAFRAPASAYVIRKVAKENALFSLATALPDIIPVISLPWAVGEFASDTAFITANQVRMAFLLGAASDHEIGYREQKGEVISILLSAFGWRALARELVGHIPFGGGLIPKAAIAYAGTRVAGMSLERYYREGKVFSAQERKAAYLPALERGKTIAQAMLTALKQKKAAT